MCMHVCDVDLKTHCTDLPPKTDLVRSRQPCRNVSPLQCRVYQRDGGGSTRLVVSAGQRTTLTGSYHSRAPGGSTEAVIWPISQPDCFLYPVLLSSPSFRRCWPQGLFLRNVQHKKLRVRIRFSEKPTSNFYNLPIQWSNSRKNMHHVFCVKWVLL